MNEEQQAPNQQLTLLQRIERLEAAQEALEKLLLNHDHKDGNLLQKVY